MTKILLADFESIPKKFKNIKLNKDHVFISTKKAVMYYYDDFWNSLFESKYKIKFIDIKNKIITIFHNDFFNDSIFFGNNKKLYSTGSIEGDVEKIFNEKIKLRKGIPAGFINLYNFKNKYSYIGKKFENNKLVKETTNLETYINYLKTL